jgi:hypothetical protein
MENERKLRVLQKIARQLNAASVVWAVGGSMLLYFKGVTSEFHDIDILVKADDAETVRELLSRLGKLGAPKPNPKYRSKAFYEFTIGGADVDVMAGFVIVKDSLEYDCSLRDEEITEHVQVGDESIPLHSLAAWRRNYELMGKPEKVWLIDQNEQA